MIRAAARSEEVVVELGDAACRTGSGTLVAVALESQVAVLLHDPAHRVGGLAHVGLPVRSLAPRHENPSCFAEVAVPALLDRVIAEGADRGDVLARLVGGATLFQDLAHGSVVQVGPRNLAACRAMLHVLGVPIVGEATGGATGRGVRFDVGEGTVTVSTALGADQVL